jgi:glycosyltransferase involved in cell wall biosynthesis
MRAANATVLASYWEGCPNAVVESLGCGTPVVATPVGSVPEIVVPGENGQIVPARNVEALAVALEEVLARDWASEKLSRGVRSWEDVAESVYTVFQDALSGGPREGAPHGGTAEPLVVSQEGSGT